MSPLRFRCVLWVRNMADLLESTCYEILCLLYDCMDPPLPDGDLYLQQESAICGLTLFVQALKRRGSYVVLQSHHQLQHRLFDLSQLILLTDVGELTNVVDDFIFNLLDLCRTLQPSPGHQTLSSANKQVSIALDSSMSDIFLDAKCVNDAKHDGASSDIDCNKGYLKISYLLEAYVRYSKAKQKMTGVWRSVESVVSEFAVCDADRSCVALRRRLDEVVEMVDMLAVVEDETPLHRFLQPQVDDIFAALKEDTLEVPISLVDRTRLARRRLRRWLERLLIRILHCLRCSLAAC